MLLCFLLFFLSQSEAVNPYAIVPKVKFLFVYGDYDDDKISEMQNEYDKDKIQNLEDCKKHSSQDFCKVMYDMLDFIYSNGKSLTNDLQNLGSDTDMLLVTMSNFVPKDEIDLNVLKSTTLVYLTSSTLYNPSKILSQEDLHNMRRRYERKMIKKVAKFLNTHGSLKDTDKFIQTLFPKKNKEPKDLIPLSIVGGIKSKVPFLYVANVNVKIVKSDLDCFSSTFIACTFDSETKKIVSNYLLVDKQSHNSINIDNVDVNQYTLYLLNINTNYDSDETFYKVSYWKEQWKIYFRTTYSALYEDMSLNVPYTSAKSFGIVVVSLNIDISRNEDDVVATVKDVNVSVIQNLNVPSASKTLADPDKETISITASGWEGQSSKPKVIVTTDKKLYDVDSSKAGDLKVEVQDQYVYQPKKEEKKKKPNVGLIVGIVVAAVVVVVVVIVVVVVVIKKKNKVQNSADQ